jgi:excisionase family DNA binding protein
VPKGEERLSLREAADALGVSEVTARRWVKAGKLKAHQPGRKYLIPSSAVDDLLRSDSGKGGRRSSPELEAEERHGRVPEVHTGGANLEGTGSLHAEGRMLHIADEDMRAIIRGAVQGELSEDEAMAAALKKAETG